MTVATPRKKRTAASGTKLEKIGLATAKLHQLLNELGHDRGLQQTASTMPDARDRLSYIDGAMHEASEKTISAVETAIPLTKSALTACAELSERLSAVRFNEHGELVAEVISKLGEIATTEEAVHRDLMHIMEAQEFRDVAGQMVHKIVNAAVEIERIMLELLREYAPNAQDSLISSAGLTAGPSAQGSVKGQDEVDDLLASLGF